MRRPRLLPILLLALHGCGDPQPAPDDDHPDVHVVPPALAPPPPRPGDLDRDEVLARAQDAEDPAEAIRELDRHRFAFELDEATLVWFGQQGLDPQVQDYLEKRSKVDWEALRGDVDPDNPAAPVPDGGP